MRLTIQDAMGHRTSEVYDFTRLTKGVVPFKGEQRLSRPHTWSKIDVYPGTTKPIPGRIRLLRADATFFKNQLARKLVINPGNPGAVIPAEAWYRLPSGHIRIREWILKQLKGDST